MKDGSFESPLLQQGQTIEHRFDRPGVYPYYCAPHPHMQAEVVVE
jgi:plastocyanin